MRSITNVSSDRIILGAINTYIPGGASHTHLKDKTHTEITLSHLTNYNKTNDQYKVCITNKGRDV